MSDIKIEVTIDRNEIIKQKVLERVGEIYARTIRSVTPKIIDKANQIVRTAIDSYYDSYDPKVYKRTESLYSVFHPEFTRTGFDLVFDESRFKGHRADDEYIYNVMFKKGYHGGAPHNGGYYWRFPSPNIAYEMGVPPYCVWYPWGPAVQSESPWEAIQEEWNEYANNEGKKVFLDTFCSEVKRVIKEVS